MPRKDLRSYLDTLDEAGLLRRISAEVDLKHELGAISSLSLMISGLALIFENISGTAVADWSPTSCA
ncbi:MAG: hypothetical protein ACREBS_03340 [Nitrososphaerales archaeon]